MKKLKERRKGNDIAHYHYIAHAIRSWRNDDVVTVNAMSLKFGGDGISN